eukprot:759541-Hanusia_phi.AAC.7
MSEVTKQCGPASCSVYNAVFLHPRGEAYLPRSNGDIKLGFGLIHIAWERPRQYNLVSVSKYSFSWTSLECLAQCLIVLNWTVFQILTHYSSVGVIITSRTTNNPCNEFLPLSANTPEIALFARWPVLSADCRRAWNIFM